MDKSKLDERKWMEHAVQEAKKSRDEEDSRVHPRVGVVVVKGAKVLATAYRGEKKLGEHAEYTALERKLADGEVTGATVFTTLEPCTSRRHPKTPCAKRLIERKVDRVVIGMLDPNKEIRGTGEWQLAEHNIKIGRFDSDLMQSLMDLNRDFIRDQQRLGMRITFPANKSKWRRRACRLKGTNVNPPGDDVLAITYVAGNWWPQLAPIRVLRETTNEWEVDIDFGEPCTVKIYIVKANAIGMELVNYYRKMVYERNQAITRMTEHFNLDHEEVRRVLAPAYWPFTMATLPHGLEAEDCITLDVVAVEP
jgi:pyrimidine deaminase RibD-like protein